MVTFHITEESASGVVVPDIERGTTTLGAFFHDFPSSVDSFPRSFFVFLAFGIARRALAARYLDGAALLTPLTAVTTAAAVAGCPKRYPHTFFMVNGDF